ncbi:MAG: SGNH/GDSL hydrolase family protein [Pseudomonadota bacterium]
MARWILVAALLALAPIAAYGAYALHIRLTYVNLSALPEDGIALCSDETLRDGKTVLIALGDSLTRANMSFDYVGTAAAQLGENYLVLRHATNGITASDLADDLGGVIACQPDLITLMIGTNDALYADPAPIAKAEAWPETRQAFGAMIGRLKAETLAEIAVFSLPHAGDGATGGLNQRVSALSDVLTADAASAGITVLPLRARQSEQLAKAANPNRVPCDTLEQGRTYMKDVLKVARQRGATVDYDALASATGHTLTVDCIHMSAISGKLAADLLVAFAKATTPQERLYTPDQ